MKNLNQKVQNLKAISRYLKIINMAVFFILILTVWKLVPYNSLVGERNMLVLNIIFCGLVFFFMEVLEKYAALFSGMSEKIVINILSSIYSFVIMTIINAILFGSKQRLMADLLLVVTSAVFLTLSDWLLDSIVKKNRHLRTPKLLIINSDSKTLLRMKRIKYGALSTYDSWYEDLNGADMNEFEKLVKEKFPEFDAICILDGLTDEQYSFAVKTALDMQKDLFVVPNILDAGITNAKIVRFDDVLALYMPKHYISETYLLVKRVMDILFALIGLTFAAIPMLLIAAAIKLTSPGPVFYKQERMTMNKKRFMIYKFRTMIPDAEKLTGPKFAEKDDPRITKVGKILRACRLDELPQIINILKGDMSLVGPRPERPVFVEQFEKEIENYDYRFSVKAGLTSLSHVYGRYSTYIYDRTYYDLFYITNYSLLMDLKIILLTSKTMFIKSAAEGLDVNHARTQTACIEFDKKEKVAK